MNEEALSNLNIMRSKLKTLKKASMESLTLYQDHVSEKKNSRRKRRRVASHPTTSKECCTHLSNEDSDSGDDYESGDDYKKRKMVVKNTKNKETKL